MMLLEHELEEFGRRLGMSSLSLSPEGRACLDIENIGRFHLELTESGGGRTLMVYLSAPLPPYDAGAARRMLELGDYRKALPLPVSAGVFSGRGILLVRLDEAEATAANIENAFRFLAELFRSVS